MGGKSPRFSAIFSRNILTPFVENWRQMPLIHPRFSVIMYKHLFTGKLFFIHTQWITLWISRIWNRLGQAKQRPGRLFVPCGDK
jgi:hypothetical protein